MRGQAVIVGSVNLDVQVRTDEAIEPGATRRAYDFLAAGGGKAGNRALLARALGVPAALHACVGKDDFAERALRKLIDRGVDVKHVHRVEGADTAVSLIVVGDDGDKTILLAANANEQWPPAAVRALKDAVDGAPEGTVLSLDLEVSDEAIEAALDAGRSRGHVVVVDASPADRLTDQHLARIDYLTPNPVEAQTITGIRVKSPDDAMRAAAEIARRGTRNVLVKLPDGGCALWTEHAKHVVRAPKVEAVDKNGAGDAFAGVLTVALCEGQSPLVAATWGVAASTLAVTAYGAQADYLDRERLARMVERVKVDS